MYLRGNFPLRCHLELSGPDFPFSINQDPGYPPLWGKNQAASVGVFVSLPGDGGKSELNSAKPTFYLKRSSHSEGSGTITAARVTVEGSFWAATAAWPGEAKVFEGVPPLLATIQALDGRTSRPMVLQMGNQDGIRHRPALDNSGPLRVRLVVGSTWTPHTICG